MKFCIFLKKKEESHKQNNRVAHGFLKVRVMLRNCKRVKRGTLDTGLSQRARSLIFAPLVEGGAQS